MSASDHTTAAALMDAFARRTGLDGHASPRRYLWTDAFAACNFLGLADSGDAHFDTLARRTIAQVHEVLAHFRADDTRTGWLRGAHGNAEENHPTRAGLRIGKPLPERDAGEPFDERLEWERDGQYFHYLTRWMHALDRCARRQHTAHFNRWARELADTAHRAFTASGGRRMYWKMSTDLARPLVASMGQHDPLDGLLTARQLRATAQALGDAAGPALLDAIADYTAMLQGIQLATSDPLGLGGLLADALRLDRLSRSGSEDDRALLDRLLASALASLPHCHLSLDAPAGERLGFRELGLAIGLAALERLIAAPASRPDHRRLDALQGYLPLRQAIQDYWLHPAHRAAPSWTAHRDINEVMLATALAPAGWLGE